MSFLVVMNFIRSVTQLEQINFLLTNRIPRRLFTQFMGWYSQIENGILTRISISIWRLFSPDLNFSEAKNKRFSSLHECFIRELKEGARSIDMRHDIVASPCDAVIGASGEMDGTTILQAKGFSYDLADLIPNPHLREKYAEGIYVTLRLKSSMYHRFHAPLDCSVNKITYISGDTWNVNPIALSRIEKLYCRNERAVVELNAETGGDHNLLLVPVAAILVASIRFNCLDSALDLKYRGPNVLRCHAAYRKGDEMGYFQHGSTIILIAPSLYTLAENIQQGDLIKMGMPLLQLKNKY